MNAELASLTGSGPATLLVTLEELSLGYGGFVSVLTMNSEEAGFWSEYEGVCDDSEGLNLIAAGNILSECFSSGTGACVPEPRK